MGSYISAETQDIQILANGAFGKVVRTGSMPWVVKIIPLTSYRKTSNLEVGILQDIKDIKGVVKYINHTETAKDMLISTEYLEGVELFDYIIDKAPVGETVSKIIFRQLCTTMMKVHSKGIVHRDLKPENIIINPYTLGVTILDWGLAFYPAKTAERLSAGSLNYAAPEVLSSADYNGPEIDVWSLGVILYALLTARLPFDSAYIKVLLDKIILCDVSYDHKGLTPKATALLKRIFVCKDRIMLDDILQSEFLKVKHPQKLIPESLF